MRHRLKVEVACLVLAACGPATPESKAGGQVQVAPEKDPASSEWLYVTRGMQGSRDNECGSVLEALRAETNCRRGFCLPGARLAEDWMAVCGNRPKANASEVRALEAKFKAAARPPDSRCEREFETLMSDSCAPTGDPECVERAQEWATKCGNEYGTPLGLLMLSARVERATGESVVLDVRSCDEFGTELASGLDCSNLPACRDRLPVLADFRTRCAPPASPVPLSRALVMMAVQAAAQRPVEPIQLMDVELKQGVPLLALADGQGAILRVGWSHPTSFEAYVDAVRAADGADVQVAKIFRSDSGAVELRLGKLTALEGHTLGERFPSFRVHGEVESLENAAVALLQQKLMQASTASPREAAARLLEGVAALAALPEVPEAGRNALHEADAKLKGMCRWLGEEKSKQLSKIGDRPALVAATRRSERLPLADLTEMGNVAYGHAIIAGSYDARADMPQCSGAYDEGLAFVVGRVRTTKISKADEDKLTAHADAKAAACAAASKTLVQAQKKVFECAFTLRQCSEDEPDLLTQAHDDAAVALRRARGEASLALASLREDLRAARAVKLVRDCLVEP